MKSLGIPFKQRPLFFSSHSHMKRWRPLHQELLHVVPKSTSPVPPCDKLQQSKTTPQLCLNFCAEGGGRYLLNTNHQQSYRPAVFGKFSGMNGLMTIKHYYIYLGLNILVNHIFFLLLTLPNFLFFWQTRKDQELTFFWPWCYYSFNTIIYSIKPGCPQPVCNIQLSGTAWNTVPKWEQKLPSTETIIFMCLQLACRQSSLSPTLQACWTCSHGCFCTLELE